MSKTNGPTPVGYGHDAKGAAGGSTKGDGRPAVAHTAPADTVSGEGTGPKTITFTLDGEEVHARDGETIWQVAKRNGTDIPHLCYAPEPGYRPDGNCRACMVEIEGERVLAASCIRTPTDGMKVKSASDRAKAARKMVFELLIADQPDRSTQAHDPASKFWNWADRIEIASSRLPAREKAARAGPQPYRDGGQSRCLHPVQSVRPRLPRSAGQRRDRHGGTRPQRKDRVRFRRSDGPVDLRRLRRMRAGLPDRRADALDAGERETTFAPPRISPTARCTACARIAVSAASSPTISRTTSCSTSPARKARRTRTGSASKAASASTM